MGAKAVALGDWPTCLLSAEYMPFRIELGWRQLFLSIFPSGIFSQDLPTTLSQNKLRHHYKTLMKLPKTSTIHQSGLALLLGNQTLGFRVEFLSLSPGLSLREAHML